MKKNMLADIIGTLLATPPEPLPEPLTSGQVLLRDIESYHMAFDLANEPYRYGCFWRRSWGEPPGGMDVIYLEDLLPLASEARPIDLDAWNRLARPRGKSQVFWDLASGSTWEFRGYSGDDSLNGVRPRMIWCD